MGGQGSGSWYRWDSKETTESQKRIDIRWLRIQGYFRSGYCGTLSWSRCGMQTGFIGYRIEADYMVLDYRYRENRGEWEEVEQIVHFDRTPCNYGGYRTWFLCPRCWRRVAVLYGAGKYFYCRNCYNLTYGSQQESRADRLMRKSRTIRKRLGGTSNMLEPFPEKPKNMHWETYNRLREHAEYYENLGWLTIGQKFGIRF